MRVPIQFKDCLGLDERAISSGKFTLKRSAVPPQLGIMI
jgi:hypothetical protein